MHTQKQRELLSRAHDLAIGISANISCLSLQTWASQVWETHAEYKEHASQAAIEEHIKLQYACLADILEELHILQEPTPVQ